MVSYDMAKIERKVECTKKNAKKTEHEHLSRNERFVQFLDRSQRNVRFLCYLAYIRPISVQKAVPLHCQKKNTGPSEVHLKQHKRITNLKVKGL